MDRDNTGSIATSGVAAFACIVQDCVEVATILIAHRDSTEQPLCASHWQAAHQAAVTKLRPVTVLPRPACFVPGCGAGAVQIMRHLDDNHLPCCERHLDDLSWVMPEAVLEGQP